MKSISQEKLSEILEKHQKWLRNESGGKRADLRHMNLSRANLSYANLSEAVLSYAYLNGANLRNADMSGADMRGAILRYAVLCGADMSYADLSFTNLIGVDLSTAKLNYCIGNMREVKSMQIDTWRVVLCGNKLSIGCETHSVEEWASFDDERIAEMHAGALEWWAKWRHIVLEIARLSVGA